MEATLPCPEQIPGLPWEMLRYFIFDTHTYYVLLGARFFETRTIATAGRGIYFDTWVDRCMQIPLCARLDLVIHR